MSRNVSGNAVQRTATIWLEPDETRELLRYLARFGDYPWAVT